MVSQQATNEITNPSIPLADFITSVTYDEIPEEACDLVETAFVDTVGVTLAGSAEGAGEIAGKTVAKFGNATNTSIIGTDKHASVTDSAFANGTSAHGLDFDDVSFGMNGHPSVVLVSPILSVGEDHSSTGKEAIEAYVSGFETMCYLNSAMTPRHILSGWHPTAILGTFGATAATASLLDLDTEETKNALNIAASMASGILRNVGTMVKPMHAGSASRSGITAAYLASEGFNPNDNAIGAASSSEVSKKQGFMQVYTQFESDQSNYPELGSDWQILEHGIHIKTYPACYYTHTGISGTQKLVEEHSLTPDDIESIRVEIAQGARLQNDEPTTGLEAKFSNPYTIACAVVHDRIGLSLFETEKINDDEVWDVMERVEVDIDEDLSYDSHLTRVEIQTKAGDVYEIEEGVAPGAYEKPLSDDELFEKFSMCSTRAISEEATKEAFEKLRTLRNVQDISDVMNTISG